MSLPVDPWHNPHAPDLPPAAEAVPAPYPPAPYPSAHLAGAGYLTPPSAVGYPCRPMSDKSKVVAGLLQLIPSVLFGLAGIGRLYTGQTSLGVAQIVATVVGWISFWCGFVLIFPFAIYAAVWLWGIVDGIVILAGQPVDGNGRALRT